MACTIWEIPRRILLKGSRNEPSNTPFKPLGYLKNCLNQKYIIGKQFLRAALSVGANYRAVCRARSKAEFFAKLSITVEEADEVVFWIEILRDSGIVNDENIQSFEKEAREILAVLTTARKNT